MGKKKGRIKLSRMILSIFPPKVNTGIDTFTLYRNHLLNVCWCSTPTIRSFIFNYQPPFSYVVKGRRSYPINLERSDLLFLSFYKILVYKYFSFVMNIV